MKRVTLALLAMACLLIAAGASCENTGELPAATFTARDFSFTGPDRLPAGLVRFNLDNAGSRAHMLGVVSLRDGKTADDLLRDVRAHPNDPFPSYAVEMGGPDAVDPGARSVGYVNLAPGQYAVYCQMPDGDTGHSHLDLGMIHAFTVGGTAAAQSVPEVSDTLQASEFRYQLDTPIVAGSQTIKVHNAGAQRHEAQLARLPDGVSVDQYIALSDSTSLTKGASYGGVAPIQPGADGYFNAYFTPGTYAFICFVTDPTTGRAHFQLGQIQQFTVR
jgi:hypothetical protein